MRQRQVARVRRVPATQRIAKEKHPRERRQRFHGPLVRRGVYHDDLRRHRFLRSQSRKVPPDTVGPVVGRNNNGNSHAYSSVEPSFTLAADPPTRRTASRSRAFFVLVKRVSFEKLAPQAGPLNDEPLHRPEKCSSGRTSVTRMIRLRPPRALSGVPRGASDAVTGVLPLTCVLRVLPTDLALRAARDGVSRPARSRTPTACSAPVCPGVSHCNRDPFVGPADALRGQRLRIAWTNAGDRPPPSHVARAPGTRESMLIRPACPQPDTSTF